MQTVTGKKVEIPAEWLALGARLGDLVNVIADRDDLVSRVFPGNSSPGVQQAAAWFVPKEARVNIDADKVLPGIHPDDVDLYTPQGQASNMALMGALTHECAHAAHTVLKFTKEHKTEHVKWGILLEETRIEKKALERRPQDRPFLAACATELVFGGNLTMASKDRKHTPSSLARSAVLLLGRADAGVFDADTLTDIQTYFETEFGQDEADKLREIWLKAQALEDGDLDGLVACGKEVYDLLNEHPDAEDEQQSQQQQQQGGGAGDDGKSGESGEPGDAGGAGGDGSSDDSTDDAGDGSSDASGDSKSKSGSKGGSGKPEEAQGDSDDTDDTSTGSGSDKSDDDTGDESGDKATGGGASNDDDSDEEAEGASGGAGDGEGDEDGEAFQMPCGSWTEGDLDDSRADDSDDASGEGSDGDDGEGDDEGDGDSDGKSDDALNKAIQAAMKKISIDAKRDVTLTIPIRRNLKKQRDAAAKEKREYIRNKNTADRVFRPPNAGTPGIFGHNREIQVLMTQPTADDKRNANMLTKELRKAQHRDIHRTQVPSMTPPGRMLINEAARRDAQRSRGEEITATPWRQTRRRVVQSPPLLVGLSVDVSGSMDAWQRPVAAFGWALANSVRALEGKTASVAWNGGTKAVMFPNRIYKDIQVAQCGGVSTGLATSLDALDGEIELARAEGVRVQVILTDGQIDESGIQERIDRLVQSGVLVIWIETPSHSWYGNSTTFGGYVPRGVKHLELEDPNTFGQAVGRFIANALSQYQPLA